jgi:hypothetical protein
MSESILYGANVTRAQLAEMPTPDAMGARHRPIPHIEFVDTLLEECGRFGWEVVKERYSVKDKGNGLYGVLDFKPATEGAEMTNSLGFRGSNAQKIAREVVAGKKVEVCDNGIFSGDMIAMHNKQTSGLDIREAIRRALDAYAEQVLSLEKALERLGNTNISDDQAKCRIHDVFAQGIMPSRLFGETSKNFFRPEAGWTDCEPRTLLGLHNAHTRAVKGMKPAPAFEATNELGREFGLHAN